MYPDVRGHGLMRFDSSFHSCRKRKLYDHLFKHENPNVSLAVAQHGNSDVGIVGPKIKGNHVTPICSATQYDCVMDSPPEITISAPSNAVMYDANISSISNLAFHSFVILIRVKMEPLANPS